MRTGTWISRREVNFRMSALIDRYWQTLRRQEEIQRPGEAVLEGIRQELGHLFVREVDGLADVDRWYQRLTDEKGLSRGYGRAALQRHAPHDGEGGDDLVQGDRHRPEPGRPGGSEAAGRPAGSLPVGRGDAAAEAVRWTRRCTGRAPGTSTRRSTGCGCSC